MDNRLQKKKSQRKEDKNREVEEGLVSHLDDLLSRGMVDHALETVLHRGSWQNAKDTAWAIIDLVGSHMENGFETKAPNQYEQSALLLCNIAGKLDPDEAMSKFTDSIEDSLNDERFVYTLRPIQVCLQKIFKNRAKGLEKMIKLIHHNFMECHPVPRDSGNEGENGGRKTASDPYVKVFNKRVTYVYEGIIQFYEPFMYESARRNTSTLPKKIAALQKQKLIVFILRLLGKPLIYLDLQDGGVRSHARKIAEELVFDLSKLVGDYFMFFANAEEKESNCFYTEMAEDKFYTAEDNNTIYIPTAALANLYYLLIVEEIGIDRTPCVYDPVYIWMNSMYLATVLIMFEDYESTVASKGLLLFKKVTARFKDLSIPHQVLEARTNKRFTQALADFDAKTYDKEIKALVTECLHLYIFKLDHKGRYLLLANIILEIKEPNFVAKLTTILLEILSEALKTSPMTPFFSGDCLFNLLSSYTQISQIADNDIVDAHSQIVASLKVLQFLYASDTHDASGIQKHAKHFKSKFLGPLEEALIKFRADYELRLKDVEDCLASAPQRKTDDLPDSMIDWIVSGEMKRESDSMIAEIQSSLNGFHLVDYWLAQIVAGPAIQSQYYIARTYNIGAQALG